MHENPNCACSSCARNHMNFSSGVGVLDGIQAEAFEFIGEDEFEESWFNESEEFEGGNTLNNSCSPFIPVAVEAHGGGRIKDKRVPQASELVPYKRASGGTIPVHRLTAAALDALICAARAEGIKAPHLLPQSGFRSPKDQKQKFARAVRKYGTVEAARKWVAPPGSSAHQSGRAIDFHLGGKLSKEDVSHSRTLPAYKWLVANAQRFGFYPYSNEPWHWEYNPPATALPRGIITPLTRASSSGLTASATSALSVIRQETIPPAQTLYVNIPLGSESPARPMTGIFIPQNFRPRPSVDLIIYIHGIKKPDLTIDKYWNASTSPYFSLREHLNQSGKDFILVAPTLGLRSQRQIGWLNNSGGLDKYIDLVLNALSTHSLYKNSGQRPAIGNIILACHSGGGLAMRTIALANNHYSNQIKECWGFDCTYNNDDHIEWAKWARNRPDGNLYLYYISGTKTAPEAKKLQGLRLPCAK